MNTEDIREMIADFKAMPAEEKRGIIREYMEGFAAFGSLMLLAFTVACIF